MLTSAVLVSCQKEGPEGPAGPAGPQGPQGPAGPTGSANVTTVVFDAPAWSLYQINLTVPQITESVYNDGVVLAYMSFTSLNTVYYHVPGLVINAAYSVRLYHQVGTMRFNLHSPSGGAATGTAPAVAKIKVIIIPAGTVVSGRKGNTQQAIYEELASAGVDINDYESVKNYYQLAD